MDNKSVTISNATMLDMACRIEGLESQLNKIRIELDNMEEFNKSLIKWIDAANESTNYLLQKAKGDNP